MSTASPISPFTRVHRTYEALSKALHCNTKVENYIDEVLKGTGFVFDGFMVAACGNTLTVGAHPAFDGQKAIPVQVSADGDILNNDADQLLPVITVEEYAKALRGWCLRAVETHGKTVLP